MSKCKFKKGDRIRVLAVQLQDEMGHLIDGEFILTNVSSSEYDDYRYEIYDEIKGYEWYFKEDQIELAVRDEAYFEREKLKLIEELKLLQEKFDKYYKELLKFNTKRQKEKENAKALSTL